jgi:hypothetical protein
MAREKLEFAPDSPMSDFMDVTLASPTRQEYLSKLKLFFDSLGLCGSLDEQSRPLGLCGLLDKQSREFLVRARGDVGRQWLQDGLKYFIRAEKQRAEKGELAESTIRNYYKPVRLFCSVHDIELTWKKITDIMPIGKRVANDRAPTIEEVQKVIGYPDRRIKPIVLVTCSSGIRVGAWEYLRWKHIDPIIRDDRIVAAKIIVYAGENEQYFSFITPEAFEALQEWMNYRKKNGEEINGESWLMRTLWDTTNPNSEIKSPSKMTTEGIRGLVKRALVAQGLRTNLGSKAKRHEWKANHGFRKFFQTNAEPKMKSLDVMTLMGQDTGLAASYNKPTVDMLLDEYLKAVDNLTINKSQKDVVRNQQVLAAEMEAKDQEMQQIRLQLESLQQDLQDFKEFEIRRAKNLEYDRKKKWQEIVEEMKRTGKDLKTVLSERLDTDVLISRVKNDEKLPRISRELTIEELISMKNEEI